MHVYKIFIVYFEADKFIDRNISYVMFLFSLSRNIKQRRNTEYLDTISSKIIYFITFSFILCICSRIYYHVFRSSGF